ncbi:DUF3102 domain-containing protein [Anaerotignum sp. MB30-C6]|uniref:DUF3102 domain-containing protein n=1 Tax=Anaerotignum sp. MB30-C6 TaxID=3070814 RepID=UPI0027DDC39C|nr:DUF3102 domain-containing protein [Anaerotignum sp. MB30-C6]WMI81578.1 DUF3102 domain-containing protein [Anaerotignum sp. MB30-C6]
MDELAMGNQCELSIRPIEVITQEIQFYKGQATMAIIEIGRRLEEAKLRIPHGRWGEWLKNEIQFSERTAQNFMRIAREYPNPQTVAVLGNSMSKALALLTLPPEDREDFLQETHVIDGEEKTVADMSTREMERLVKELEAERKAKGEMQLRIDTLEMEANQEKLNESEQVAKAEEKQREAEERLATLQAELDAAHSEPQATEIDGDVLEQIRKDAEEKEQEKLKKKIQKAEKDAEKAKKEAEDAKKKLQEQEAAVSSKISQAEQVAAQKEQAIQDLQKQLAMAGDSKKAIFKVHFEGVQVQLNKMLSCINELKEKEEAEEAVKLKAALTKLCEMMLDTLKETEDL